MARWMRIAVAAEEGSVVDAARARAPVPMLLTGTGRVTSGLAVPTSSKMKVVPVDGFALAEP